LEDILQATILLLGISLFVVAAYGDVKTLQIPNALVLAIAVLGALRLIVIADPTVTLYTVSASVVVFIVAFLLFWRGLHFRVPLNPFNAQCFGALAGSWAGDRAFGGRPAGRRRIGGSLA
jgi:hypothetical protein